MMPAGVGWRPLGKTLGDRQTTFLLAAGWFGESLWAGWHLSCWSGQAMRKSFPLWDMPEKIIVRNMTRLQVFVAYLSHA